MAQINCAGKQTKDRQLPVVFVNSFCYVLRASALIRGWHNGRSLLKDINHVSEQDIIFFMNTID